MKDAHVEIKTRMRLAFEEAFSRAGRTLRGRAGIIRRHRLWNFNRNK